MVAFLLFLVYSVVRLPCLLSNDTNAHVLGEHRPDGRRRSVLDRLHWEVLRRRGGGEEADAPRPRSGEVFAT